MSQKTPNNSIRCSVESCDHHCGTCNYCSLSAIQIEACPCGNSGMPEDESMCGSYRAK